MMMRSFLTRPYTTRIVLIFNLLQLPAHQAFMKLRITRALKLDMRGGVLNFAEIFRRQFDVQGSQILVEATQMGCAGYRNDPWLLRQQPGERDLSGCCFLFPREFRD